MAINIIICEAGHSEKGSGHYGYDGSVAGDQLQKHKEYSETAPLDDYRSDEVRINSWYNLPWKHIYKPKNGNIANVIAIRAEQTVRNPNVGYSQPKRLGYYNALMNDYDPSHINTAVECDCSSMVNSIVYVSLKSVGISPSITGKEVTAQMEAPYKKMCERGIFEDIIGKVNLQTGEGVSRGCVLLGAPATHTAICLLAEKKKETENTPLWVGKVYNCGKLNVRTGAGVTNKIYKPYPLLSVGNLVDVCGEKNGWYYVRIAGIHYAWVSAKYITKVG